MLAAQKPLELQVYHTVLPKATLLQPAANIRLVLEKTLWDFYFVTGLQLHIERGILPEFPDVINCNL